MSIAIGTGIGVTFQTRAAGGGGPPPAHGPSIVEEDGTSYILMEDGTSSILTE